MTDVRKNVVLTFSVIIYNSENISTNCEHLNKPTTDLELLLPMQPGMTQTGMKKVVSILFLNGRFFTSQLIHLPYYIHNFLSLN